MTTIRSGASPSSAGTGQPAQSTQDTKSTHKASDASSSSVASAEPAAPDSVAPPKLDEFAQVPDTSVRAKTIGASMASQEGAAAPKGDEHLAAELRATRSAAHAHEHHAGGRVLGSSEEHSHTHGEAHGRGGGDAVAKLDGDKLAYDTDVYNGGKLNPKLPAENRSADQLANTHEQLDKQLNDRFKGGVTFKPPLKKDAHGADVKWALLNTGSQSGQQSDVAVNLNGTTNLASIDHHSSGKATVTVHGSGTPEVPAASQFGGYENAKAALEKDFGVKVAERPKKFSKDELEKVHAGFSLLSAKEQKALKGVSVERHNSLANGMSGYFKWDSKTDRKGTPSRTDKLQLADSAFDSDSNKFLGSGKPGSRLPPSVGIIAHEAAHAVDSHRRRDALFNHAKTKQDFSKSASGAYGSAQKAWASAQKKLPASERAALGDFNKASANVDKSIAALANAKPADVEARRADLDAATAARDAALGKLPGGHPAHGAATTRSGAQDAHATLAGKHAEQITEKSEAISGEQSTRLKNYADFVKKEDVKPLTDYAAGGDIAEHYAEAMALYKTDPEYLKANSSKLYEYFEAGKHAE